MVKKTTRNTIIGIFLVLGLIAIGIFAFGTQQTALSVDRVEVLGEGDKLRITTTTGAENAIVDLDRDELNQQLSGEGWSVDRGVRVSADLVDYTVEAPITRTNQEYFGVEIEPSGENVPTFFASQQDYIDKCQQARVTPTVYGFARSGGFVDDLWCARLVKLGDKGVVQGSTTDNFEVRVGATGFSDEFITPNNQRAVFGNDDIIVTYEGSLQEPSQLTDINYDALWRNSRFEWLVEQGIPVDQNARSTIDSGIDSCVSTNGLDFKEANDFDQVRDCIFSSDDDIRDGIGQANRIPAPSIVDSVNLNTDSGNQGTLVMDTQPTSIPVLVLEIDGSFLGIEKLSGSPQITSCVNDISTISGNTDEMRDDVVVENVGSQQGDFFISTSCDNSNLGVDTISTLRDVNPGQSESFTAQVSGFNTQADTTETGECTINIEDRNSGASDSCTFSVELEFADDCPQGAGNMRCSEDGSEILRCNEDGNQETVVETCSGVSQCSFTDSEFQCIIDGGIGDGDGTDDGDGTSGGFFGGLFGDNFFGDVFDGFTNFFDNLSGFVIIAMVLAIAVLIGIIWIMFMLRGRR